MEKKMKKAIAVSAIAMTAVTAMPFASVNAYAEKGVDNFKTSIDVDGLLINNAALVSIEQASMEEMDVTVASVLDYSKEQLSALTGTDGNPFVISCQDAYGIKYNPDTTAVMFYCDEYDDWGDLKIRSHNSDDWLGSEKTGKKRIYWERNADCLKAGTGLFGCRILLFGDDSAEVEVFGKKYTLTAETTNALETPPVPMYATVDTEPVTPETAPAVQETVPITMPVLSNVEDFGTKLETTAVTTTKLTETTAVTTTAVTTTTAATTILAETTVQTAPMVQTVPETSPVMPAPAVQETTAETIMPETVAEAEEISVQPAEGEWKVVQVMIPEEATAETEDTSAFPIIPTIAGNAIVVLVGFLVKMKFF